MNDFLGVWGAPDPARALRSAGAVPAWHDDTVAFGGAPVWTDAAGTLIVSGELVLDNAEMLRAELGCPEASAGEVIAELLACRGMTAIRQARGMFALTVWDSRQKRLWLLRDQVGARTLYHTNSSGRQTWFGARLRTVARCPGIARELSLPALRDYLTCAYVPGAQTLWRDVRELRPGTALSLPGGETQPWWEPKEDTAEFDAPMESHAAQVRVLLEDAVRDCLPASGPVAVFLSGGLDSSLVTALAARDAPGPVHTFALHFGRERPHELEFSESVARHCGTRHHVLELPGRVIRETLPETMRALDNPIGDPLTVPNLLLARAARQEADIALNGEGGDPCFGGPKNLPMLLHELYAPSGQDRIAAYLRSYQKCFDDLPRLLLPDVRMALRDAPPPGSFLAPFLEHSAMTQYLNRLMLANVRLKGADHILTKVANLTSACGLTGRSPLFDPRIVEASFRIPPAFKLSGASEKAVLKRAVSDLLPAAILERPKSGMLVPVQGWFQRELKGYARGLLLSRGARIRPYVNTQLVREWLAYRGELWPRYGVKLWLLLTLELWLRVNEE